MKLIKAKIEVVHPDASSTHFIGYPQVWLDNKEKIVAVLDPGDRLEEIIEDGKIFKILYAMCTDDALNQLLTSDLIQAADIAEARAYAEQKFPQKVITSDQDAVNAVLAKIGKGEVLAKKDLDALNPDNPEAGLTKSKNWVDGIQDNHGAIT